MADDAEIHVTRTIGGDVLLGPDYGALIRVPKGQARRIGESLIAHADAATDALAEKARE